MVTCRCQEVNMESTETAAHTVRFPLDVYAKLRKLAQLERRPINSEVVVAVEKLIADYERENGPILVESATFNN